MHMEETGLCLSLGVSLLRLLMSKLLQPSSNHEGIDLVFIPIRLAKLIRLIIAFIKARVWRKLTTGGRLNW